VIESATGEGDAFFADGRQANFPGDELPNQAVHTAQPSTTAGISSLPERDVTQLLLQAGDARLTMVERHGILIEMALEIPVLQQSGV
jgi:hypothetical protein